MKSTLAAALLAAAAMAFVPSEAGAQHFHIEFGGHHHGRHHHHHCYDWRPGFYYEYVRPPVAYIYAPPPPVRREVTYVYPTVSEAAPRQLSLAPQADVRPSPLPPAQGNAVVIRNPVTSGGAVAFVVDEKAEVSLKPGGSHSLSSGSSYLVEFDRGGGYGTARRTLGQGSFDFVVTPTGWDLVSQADSAAQLSAKPSVKRNEIPGRTNLR